MASDELPFFCGKCGVNKTAVRGETCADCHVKACIDRGDIQEAKRWAAKRSGSVWYSHAFDVLLDLLYGDNRFMGAELKKCLLQAVLNYVSPLDAARETDVRVIGGDGAVKAAKAFAIATNPYFRAYETMKQAAAEFIEKGRLEKFASLDSN